MRQVRQGRMRAVWPRARLRRPLARDISPARADCSSMPCGSAAHPPPVASLTGLPQLRGAQPLSTDAYGCPEVAGGPGAAPAGRGEPWAASGIARQAAATAKAAAAAAAARSAAPPAAGC